MNRDTKLDIIRCIAFITILNFHFCCVFNATNSFLYGYKNGGWGSAATTIFFIMSGYLMTMNHDKVIDYKEYYKHRFLQIFPTFYICFFIAYIIHSIDISNFFYGGDLWRLIYSILGIDVYLSYWGIRNYAIIGEWFTAVIIIIYLLYPFLNFLFRKSPNITTIFISILYFANVIFNPVSQVPVDANVITGIFMFYIGMLLYKHKDKWNTKIYVMLLSLLFILIIYFIPIPFYNLPIKNTMGICIFLSLNIFLSLFTYNKRVSAFFKFFADLGYPVYLIHHFIYYTYYNHFSYLLTTKTDIIIFYIVCFITTIVSAIVIRYISKIAISILKNNNKN